jgi:hypothetical protein
MTTFLALYRGKTVSDARMVAVSADQDLVTFVATRLLEAPTADEDDPVVAQVEHGRRAALRLITREVSHARD